MSYKNRSKEYDWFKGKSPENKSPKETLKLVWKFTKIFMMFSLFFFSMWGCVQVFVIKTDNHVGEGVEFYNSEDEVAPYVRQVSINKTTTKTGDIYELKSEIDQNVWLNDTETNKELKGVQAVLKKEGKNDNAHKLSDAFKGRNDYLRIIGLDRTPSTDVVAMSSQQKTYNGAYAGPFTFPSLKVYEHDTVNNAIVAKTVTYKPLDSSKWNTTTLARFNYSKAIFQALDASLKKDPNTTYLSATDDSLVVAASSNPVNPNTVAKASAHNRSVYLALGISGATFNKANSTDLSPSEYSVSPNSLGGETNYRPIISWDQAWTRGVGPFYGLFVFPISKLGVAITNGFGMNAGWESLGAIIIIVFILRLLAFALTFKSTLQQTKQQELQAKKAVIDAKYANYKGNKQMEARKRQETADLYKKEGISPLGPLGSMFITMPIFLSIWRVIGGVPHLKSTVWLGINFSETSYKELFAGEWQYLPLILFAGVSAALSQIYPRLLTKRRDKNRINVQQKAAMKKNNKTQNIVMVVYVIMALIFSAGIQIYWIVGGIWQVIQTTITHHVIINQKNRKKREKVKV